ncbi:MAG TPA: DUF2007 domain-containing protein [Allosphingosinicella sp.]|nr:DUF2007 domain-containing protein [Allosphingosinicella sp.]
MALVELSLFYDSLAAGAAQSRLSDEGIDSYIFDMGMTLQGVGFVIPVRLMVDEDDLIPARRLLSEEAGGAA